MKWQKATCLLTGVRRLTTTVLFDSHPICSPSVLPSIEWPVDAENLRISLNLRGLDEELLSKTQNLHSEHFLLQKSIENLSFTKKRNSKLLKSDLTNETLLEETRKIRSKISSLKKEWKVKHDEFLASYLKLPNIVDQNHSNVEIVLPSSESINHHSVSSDLSKYVHTSVHGCHYLLDALALWERELLDVSFVCAQQHGFIPILLSDLVRAPIVAATDGFAVRPSIEATREETVEVTGSDSFVNPYLLYHLAGSASLEAVLAFLMRNSFQKKTLPLKITTLGRDYSIKENETGPQRITQRNLVSCAVVTDSYDQASICFNEMLQQVIKYWSCLVPFLPIKISSVHPSQLKQYETARLALVAGGKVPLAHISLIGDFLSRRLMIRTTDGKDLCLVYGNLINSSDLLDALMSSGCSLNDLTAMNKRLEEEFC